MAYVSKVWVDRQTEYPTRRKLAFDDGTGDKIVTVSREEGQIYVAGDIFDANTMNNMESRIAAGIGEKQNTLIPGNGIRIDQDNVITATGGGGGIEFTKVESGSLVSVNDAADLPVVDLDVEIKAVQSGTGDPSPSNVRPISGWSNVNVTKARKNIFNVDLIDSIDTDGNGTMRNGVIFSHAGTFTVDGTQTENAYIYGKIKSGSTYGNIIYFTSGSPTTFSRSVTIAQGEELLIYDGSAVATMAASKTRLSVVQIEVGSASAFEPYNATTVTIALGQTVYGAELGVTSGNMNVSWFKFVGDDITSISRSGAADGNTTFFINLATDDFPAGVSNTAISSQFSRNTASGEGRMTHGASGIYFVVATSRLDSDTAAGGLKWLQDNDVEFCYELAQPVTVQLSGTEIETLLGINNIWADSGDILNLEYYTQSASDVRDFIIKDEEVTDDASWSSEKIQDELDAKQDSLTAGDGIVFDGNEISAVLYKELTATLNVFSTSVVFEDAAITTNSVIDIYTSKYGFNPETVTAETGRLTITFRQPEEQISVKVRIS